MLGRLASSDLQWDLLTLPTRLGGLGLPSVKRLAQQEYGISVAVTAPLTALILEQKSSLESAPQEQQQLKTAAVRTKTVNLQAFAQSVVDRLPPQGKRAVEVAKEKGSSSWLNALPIAEHGFDLSKAAFRDVYRSAMVGKSPTCPLRAIVEPILTQPMPFSAQQVASQ